MKKLFFAVSAALIAFTACNKTEVEQGELRGDITINALVEENSETNLKSAEVNRGNIPVYVDGLNITATSSHGVVTKDFTFTGDYDAGVASLLTMENVWFGNNTFTATTTPVKRGHEGIVNVGSAWRWDSDETGIVFVKRAYGWKESEEKIVDQLKRSIPYLPYVGSTNAMINAFAEGENPNVDLTMRTTHGRLILTFEFETANAYQARVYLNNSTSHVDARFGDFSSTGQVEDMKACVYWSNIDAVDGATLPLRIDILEGYEGKNGNPGTVVRTIEDAFQTMPEYFAVEAGVSKHVKVTITDSGLKASSLGNFNFTWEYEEEDKNVDL